MREISQATQEILKSQKMLGQNKFSYQLMLEGVDYYTDINEIKMNAILQKLDGFDYIFADYAIRTDGKILVAYNMSDKIYLNVIDSEQEMSSINNIGAGGQLFYTISEKSSKFYEQPFSLLRLRNGRILFFINDSGNFELNIPSTFKVYESLNGLGTDFALKKIISSGDRIGSALAGFLSPYVSKGAQDNLGNIWIFAMTHKIFSDYDAVSNIFYKSSDGGINWTINHDFNFDIVAQSRFQYPRSICIIGDNIFLTHFYDYGDSKQYLYLSNDLGQNWSIIQDNFSGLPDTVTWVSGRLLLDYTTDKTGALFMVYPSDDDELKVYKTFPEKIITYDALNTLEGWEIIADGIEYNGFRQSYFSISPRGNLHYIHQNFQSILDLALIREEYSAPIKASNISISKGKGGANSLSLSIDNDNGAINPKNPESPLYGIINFNKQIIIKQGYGSDLIETFTGLIDGFGMKSWPHTMEISCRDHLKKALDQTITEQGSHTVNFESQAIESIFGYLCYLAGIETGEIDTTGISISKEFSWQTYADAFQFLADLASFDYGADEYGKIYFKRDYQPDEIFIAYTFEEGIDITSLSYQLDDKDLYYMVIVYGKSGDNVISYTALFPDAAKYNILPQKILKVDATEASTIAELQKIADRSIYLMNSRTAIVNFAAVAVPWLQVGDFIQVNESSSMSAGIYRISSLNLKMTDKDFTMDLQCYYYGDSIEVGTLPEDTATQTGNAALNLIPEMTSNTVPSGVARASSVLTLYDNDYQPWNALNSTSDDLYWNAVSQYGWIEYTFNEKTIIDKYMLKARQAIEYNKAMPKNWQFEGFDGAKWIVLDTRSNQTSWQIHEERSFDFTNTIAYAKYRLNVSANNGFYRLQLEQLAMYYRGGA